MDCPDCGREMYGKHCACGYGKAGSKDRPAPELVKCCLCRLPVLRSGWCENCHTWPINVTSLRHCDHGHTVAVTGWCPGCGLYALAELDAQPGEWVDTGRKSRKLTKEEVQRMAREVQATLSGPGWPDVQVPLRRDMIPRRWKNVPLKVVGHTPLGHDIVFPVGVEEPVVNDVPF
jgi:hypothetical protein